MTSTFRRILVPFDFSTPARRALETAAGLAAERGGRLVVLHVVTPMYGEAGILWFPERMFLEDMRRRLTALVGRVTRTRRVAARCLVVVGTPVERILAAAKGADVIVMSTMGRTGLSRMLLGSVAERVVRYSPVPVLTVRGKSGRGGRGRRRGRRSVRRTASR
jgi:nucleotide-binding universal stress UspA family protein